MEKETGLVLVPTRAAGKKTPTIPKLDPDNLTEVQRARMARMVRGSEVVWLRGLRATVWHAAREFLRILIYGGGG